MTEKQHQEWAARLGVTVEEFKAGLEMVARMSYEDFMRRSPEENTLAIFDKLGIKLEYPLAEW